MNIYDTASDEDAWDTCLREKTYGSGRRKTLLKVNSECHEYMLSQNGNEV